jgi:hypothetical protein
MLDGTVPEHRVRHDLDPARRSLDFSDGFGSAAVAGHENGFARSRLGLRRRE